MKRSIDLSSDLGEARTAEERGTEQAIWPLISAANVACGGHVGDVTSMREAVDLCLEHGVILGAHPSFPDPEGFGRRTIEISDEDLLASLRRQISTLRDLAAERSVELRRVKPHGALYNSAQRDERLAALVVRAVAAVAPSAAVVGAGGSRVEEIAKQLDRPFIREAFGDRRYMPDGTLVSRGREGALLIDTDEAANQALDLVQTNEVTAANGQRVTIEFETLCIHSDMKGSLERLKRIRFVLAAEGFAVAGSRS